MSNTSVGLRSHDSALWQKILSEINHLRQPLHNKFNVEIDHRAPGIVIIGAGVSAMALTRQLRLHGCTNNIIVISAEPFVPYNRAQLSSALADGKSLTKLAQQSIEDFTILYGVSVSCVDSVKKCCHLSDDTMLPYQQLIFATGALSQRFAPLTQAHPRLIDFRGLADLEVIAQLNPQRVAIVGGGLLGIEAARALRAFSQQITLIERAERLMPQQLDEGAGARVAALLQDWGIDVHTHTFLSHCEPDVNQLTLTLSNKNVLTVDLVISATGVIPNTALAKQTGLEVKRGIVVDEFHRTSIADIFAIGECCQQNDRCFGSVNPCLQHAEILAPTLLNKTTSQSNRTTLTQLKLAQRTIVSIGDTQSPDCLSLIFTEIGGRYRCLKLREKRVVGAIVFDHADADINDVSFAVTQNLLLNDDESARFCHEGCLPVDTKRFCNSTLCFCANVSYDDIRHLRERQLSRSEIIALTGATTHCGSCRERLNKATGEKTGISSKGLIVAAASASLMLLLVVAMSWSLPFAKEWTSMWRNVDQIWRTDWLLQVSGYSLLALMMSAFVWAWWRQRQQQQQQNKKTLSINTHMVLALAAVTLWWVHTGGRSGHGLNFLLFILFAAAFVIGAITGQTWLQQHLSANNRRWAKRVRTVHFATLLPLPALLVFHIIKHYYF